ncbi:hypothetical protein BP5796_03849 [Coleophoma crateriformis]|uniref:Phytocyanin domain-containing protein n=1 Tax=Coleophoma crateriformis TaxID=565419 RepID=A0A3D8SH95_9HELO|nr:hypothetical protein BP5796_03849 [Coleophoma crateriformis]
MFRPLISMLAVAAAAQAATIDIDVGDNGLKFTPNTSTAAIGDVLAFHFYPGGHSVVSGPLANPCNPDATSFFSGYMPGTNSGDTTFEVTVNSTNPIWFYCSLARHCENGMVGVVNPPAGTPLDTYASAAAAVRAGTAPANPVGGVLTTVVEAASSTGSTGASSTTGSTTGSATGASTTTSSGASTTASSGSSSASSSAVATATSNAAMNVFGEAGSMLGVGVAAGFIAMIM